MFRALIGALAWPAGQCLPQLSASISLLQASSSSPTVNDIKIADMLLRFAKEGVQDHSKTLRRHGASLAKLRFCVYMDASWGIWPDGAAQGGHAIFVGTEAKMTERKPFPLTLVSWHSKKLTRLCRSSLFAEAQSAACAIDESERTKVYVAAACIEQSWNSCCALQRCTPGMDFVGLQFVTYKIYVFVTTFGQFVLRREMRLKSMTSLRMKQSLRITT